MTDKNHSEVSNPVSTVTEDETYKQTPEEKAAQKRRNMVIAWGLLGFCGLIFLVTVIRLSQNLASGS